MLPFLLSGCLIKKDDLQEVFAAPFAPVYTVSVLMNGSLDVMYCSNSFYGKNERWPTNSTELQTYVDQSNGYLFLQKFERIDLSPSTNGDVKISYVRIGHTNEVRMTLNHPTRKN